MPELCSKFIVQHNHKTLISLGSFLWLGIADQDAGILPEQLSVDCPARARALPAPCQP